MKMYRIEIPATIHHTIAMFHHSRMWSASDVNSFRDEGRRLFYLIYFSSFVLSLALGAYLTDDKDEFIFLTFVAISAAVLIYRLWHILWEGNAMLMLVHEIGTHYTDDPTEFVRVNEKLKMLMKFVQFFVVMALAGTIYTILQSVVQYKLFFNIAFPLDHRENGIAFWIALTFVIGGLILTNISIIFITMHWYLMLTLVLRYELLGNQFRNMGTMRKEPNEAKVSMREKQKLYFNDLIVAIQTYERVNG